MEERGKPFHQWDFLGDAWAIHLHDGTLGASYSVFIPYTRKTSQQAQCALRVRFTPETGSALYSDTVAVLLPGPLRKKEDKPLNGESFSDKRTSLDSITIPLKEKRKAELANMPLGQSEMHRVVAPVSELAAKHQLQSNARPAPATGVIEATSPLMETLPAAPQTFTPPVMPPQSFFEEDSAQPIKATTPPATSAFPQSANPLTTRQQSFVGNRPLIDGLEESFQSPNGHPDLTIGSN
jgi:hypothetical protein